jgi:tetratricopeptide (TPR) repeat protein
MSIRQRNFLIWLGLVLATVAVYWPVRHFDFVNYDDQSYVYENPHVQRGLTLEGFAWFFTTHWEANWHPLTWLSHMLEVQLFGLNAGGHHLVNLLFHVANALLLFHILNRMTAAPLRSAFVAALFALHPLHVESVAWIAERKDVLSAFFWMLTLWAYVRYVETLNAQRSTLNRFYALTLVFFTLGLMAKPMLVTLPFVLLLLDYWPLGRTRWADSVVGKKVKFPLSRLLMEKLPFLTLSVASCAVTLWAQHAGGAVESTEHLPIDGRIINALVSYVRYLGKAFWPDGLAVFYPLEKWPLEAVVVAAAVLLGVSLWVVWNARRQPQFVLGWLWYLGTLVPVIGLVQVGSQSMADRYSYLPLIGIFIMVAWSLPSSVLERPRLKIIAAVTAVVLLGICAALSCRQLRYWQNSVTLFEHALAVTGPNDVAHLNLGNAFLANGKIQDAISHYEQALWVRPAEAHSNIGSALMRLGRVPEAVGHFEQALLVKPDYAEAHYNLGLALAQLGNLQEAMNHWEQALRIKPDYAEAHYNLGGALWQTGNTQEAIAHWEQALRINPHYADAHRSLGLVLAQTGSPREAITHLERVLEIQPDLPDVQNKLARMLTTLTPAEGGDPVRALTMAERACALTGNRVVPYLDTLAAAYAAAGRFNDAIATAAKAIELARAAGQPQMVSEIEAHLQLYRSGQPYRLSLPATRPREP